MKRRTVLLSILLVTALAAVSVILPTLRAPRITPVVLSSEPEVILEPQAASASPSIGGPITLVAVTRTKNGFSLQAQPVDPTTLTALPGYAPINLGADHTYAISPDHKTLAVITWPSGSNIRGVLHLIALETWTDTPAELRFEEDVSDLTFSPDGKALYWTIPTEHYPSGSYQLLRYDLPHRQLSVISQFSASFVPWAQQVVSDKVAIFGVPTASNYFAEAAPRVLVIDPARNLITADLQLEGILAGQFREPPPEATLTPPGDNWQYTQYNPGLAWDVKHSALYVAPANDDTVTRIDLAKGVIVKQSSLAITEWLSELLAPTAEAKGGTVKQERTVLSPDGKWLYVFSQKTEWAMLSTASLRLIATDGMREVNRLDELLTDFALTPDGQSLLILKAEIVNPYGFDMPVNRDLYILDAKTLRERAHLRLNQVDQRSFKGFSADGHAVYLQEDSARWIEGAGWRDWQNQWQRLDLNSYRLVAADKSDTSFATLLHIGP